MTAVRFDEYDARRVVNVHRHVDGAWFWDRYTAHPYVGCRSGCEFCFMRGGHYPGAAAPDDFDRVIRVKRNAPALLRKELARRPRDVIVCGDWQQPAEDRYRLSRAMLEVILDLGFPLLVIERSPLVVRDLDLLIEIGRRAWVGVLWSVSSLDADLKRAFEPRSPGVQRRFQAMATLAAAGVPTGTSMMPILPVVGDRPPQLADVVRATADHGGRWVVASGLTLDGAQRDRTVEAARLLDPELPRRWRELYGAPDDGYDADLGLQVRELCARHGLTDRMPRPVLPGPRAVNQALAARLFLTSYDLQLERAAPSRVWAYRKAAWTVDEWPDDLGAVHRAGGAAALRALPAVGPRIADELAAWLRALPPAPAAPPAPGQLALPLLQGGAPPTIAPAGPRRHPDTSAGPPR